MEKERKNGQSTVEFALLLPLLLMIAVLIIEVSLLFHNYLILEQLAREGARAGALGRSDDKIRDYIGTETSRLINTYFLVGTTGAVSISPTTRTQGANITVSIPYQVSIGAPFFGTKTIGLAMTATSTMRIEKI